MKGNEDKIFHINFAMELLFWLIVVLLFVSLSSLGIIFKEKNDKNDYQVFLQDVDGLIVGSPVRMMGIEVGHVTKIKPTNDNVYVKFVLTNPDVYIPQGTFLTVEFSGLAGSKSLELYLPDSNDYVDSKTPLLTVERPKRLHDALGLLNDMFKTLGSIIYSTSSFGTKLQEKNLAPADFKGSSGMSDFIKYADNFLIDSDKKVTEIRKNIKGLRKNDK